MNIRPSISFLLTIGTLIGISLPTHAQPKSLEQPRKYVEFKFDPNFQQGIKDRLNLERQLGPLKDLVKHIAADPSKFPLDPEQIKAMKLDTPELKNALKDWVANDPKLKQQLEDWVKQNPLNKQQGDANQFQQDLKKILDDAPKNVNLPKTIEFPKELPQTKAIELPKPKPDGLAKVTERAMEQAENSKLGDWLRDSPAWKQAFVDLRSSMDNPDSPRFKFGDWQDKLRMPDGKMGQLGEGALGRLKDLPRPNLGRFSPSLPNVSLPNVAAPSIPNFGAPSMPSVGTGTTWILFALLCLLVGWQMLRWTKGAAPVVDPRVQLGPWPVRPEAIATRAELIQAFNYLALLTLGVNVESWNHVAITRSWRDRTPACVESAQALAFLYEQARYTEGAQTLTEAERDQARRSLTHLAEAL